MLNAFAPPFKVVAIYFIFAFCYLLAFMFLFSYSNYDFESYQFKAFLHCFFAGFALNIIIGSLYQLSSVIYEKAFFSIKGVFFVSFICNISLAFIMYSFLNYDLELLKYSVFAMILSVFYFIVLFLISFFDFNNIAKSALFCGVVFLALGLVCAGLIVLILNGLIYLDYELILHLHIYFMLGFILFICIGAASVLLPMFALTHKHKNYLLWLSLAAYFLAFFHKSIAIFSLACFVFWCLYILKIRTRKAKDYWNLNIVFACIGSFLAMREFYVLDYALAIKLLIFATILPFIIAHIYKILPFLIWFHFISKLIGKIKVPLLDDMVIKKAAFFTMLINICLVISLYFSSSIYLYIALNIGLLINVINFFTYINYKGAKNEKASN